MTKAILALCLAVGAAAGQTNQKILDFNQHLWVSYNGEHQISGPWGLHFDAQWRRSDLGTEWQQYQVRPGVNYSFSKNVRLTIGYVFTRAYPYGDNPVAFAFPEHRPYEQLVVSHKAGSVRVQHRTRLEHRFIKYPTEPRKWTYQNRFRYLVRAEIPIRGQWYVPIYNEVLIGIAPNYGARPWDQNRAFVGIGRAFEGYKVDVGYMNQFIGQRNGRWFEFNNTLVVAVSSELPLGKLLRR